jgi:hypothetical protein
MVKQTIASCLRLGLNFGIHFGETLEKVKWHIQRLLTCKMEEQSELVEHGSSIHPLTSDVDLNHL